MDSLDDLHESLELATEHGDLTDLIYAKFFDTCPSANELMSHSDQHMRGRMLEQTFELLMDDALNGTGSYFEWEIDNHLQAYGVQADMYAAFLEAVRVAVKDAAGAGWQPRHEQAWAARINSLLEELAGATSR
jgi:hypothetical protein